jgi:(4S)-4-hydroxy-5-phosphonooxypentane-2,3-dione isomerase
MRHAILVTFSLKPGKAEEFKNLILVNATASVQQEADCFQFHVTQSDENPNVFRLYEVYADAASVEVHKTQPHYKTFVAASKPLVENVTIEPLTVLNPKNLKS